QIYANRGEYAIAEKMFRHILETNPDYPIARNNLASVLVHEGKTAEAESLLARDAQHAKEARVQYPRTWIAALNLAQMRWRANDDAGAIAVLERARADYPEIWELISLESELLRRTQGPLPALRLIENYTRQNWWHHAAWLAEGRLYAENNDIAQSTRALRYAALLDVHDVQALNLLAAISVRDNQIRLDVLRGKICGVIGFGSQGHAHALNLRDNGFEVVVGLRSGSKSRPRARAQKLIVLETSEAVRRSDIVFLALPDTKMPK